MPAEASLAGAEPGAEAGAAGSAPAPERQRRQGSTTYSGEAEFITAGESIPGEAHIWVRSNPSQDSLPTWGGTFASHAQGRGKMWFIRPGEHQLVLPDGRSGLIRPDQSVLELPRLFELRFSFHGLGPPPIG